MLESNKQLLEKWAPVLDHEDVPAIADPSRKAITAQLLENEESALAEERTYSSFSPLSEAAPTNNISGGAVDTWDPVLISLVRRAMPNLLAFDVAGVQPMTGPTGLIFAMKSHYENGTGDEALFNEADTAFSGNDSPVHSTDVTGLELVDSPEDTDVATTGQAFTTAKAEAQDGGSPISAGGTGFAEMAFSIDRKEVAAKSRALKAEYTMELAQDLKAVHGLDAEKELASILSAEILGEINREMIRTLYNQAVIGSAEGAVNGVYNAAAGTGDSGGRWQAETFKGIGVQISWDANAIAKATRRGRGNFVIVSSNVATALHAGGSLDYAPAMQNSITSDDTGNLFAGVLNGNIKVFIDPFATDDIVLVGYRGTSAYDAGYFYCPYVPLTMLRATGEDTFQPKIGFKTRYGMVANPFVSGAARANTYYRIFRVANL